MPKGTQQREREMSDRYTRKDAERAFERLCEALNKPQGHYRTLAEGEKSNMANGQTFSTIPGGWALDYNPVYGGCVIEELSPTPGETWVSTPFGMMRRSPREFCQFVSDVLNGLALKS